MLASVSASWSEVPNSPFPRPAHENSRIPIGPDSPALTFSEAKNEVFPGRLRITQLKLNGLADPWMSTHRKRTDLRVRPQDVADQKIALLEVLDIFGDSQSEEQIVPNRDTLLGRNAQKRRLQSLICGQVPDFQDQVLLGLGDRRRIADRTTSLTDQRSDQESSLHCDRQYRRSGQISPSLRRKISELVELASPPRIGIFG